MKYTRNSSHAIFSYIKLEQTRLLPGIYVDQHYSVWQELEQNMVRKHSLNNMMEGIPLARVTLPDSSQVLLLQIPCATRLYCPAICGYVSKSCDCVLFATFISGQVHPRASNIARNTKDLTTLVSQEESYYCRIQPSRMKLTKLWYNRVICCIYSLFIQYTMVCHKSYDKQ